MSNFVVNDGNNNSVQIRGTNYSSDVVINNGRNNSVAINNRSERYSISSDSNSSTDSSLGFGDFENGTIYDQVVKMDTPDGDLDEHEAIRMTRQGAQIDNLRVQGSSGVVVGNQTFIEGTVIFDRFYTDNSLTETLQQKLNNRTNDIPNGSSQRGADNENDAKKSSKRCKKVIIVIVVVISLIIVLGIGAVLIYHFLDLELPFSGGHSTEAPSTVVTPTLIPTSTSSSETSSSSTESSTASTTTPPSSYTLVTRSEWGAFPTIQLNPVSHPVKTVIITETNTKSCDTFDTCKTIVRTEQKKYVETLDWFDIGHSFLSAGDSAIYEGRGWNVSGAHTSPRDNNCFVIAFIGTFKTVKPKQAQIDAYFALITDGVRQKLIHEDYEMVGHCQVGPVSRPGTALVELLKTWPHWTNTTKQC